MEDKQSYGGGNKKSKRTASTSKGGNVSTQETRILTSSDENFPTDVGGDKIYWKKWSETEDLLSDVVDQGNRETCWVYCTVHGLQAQLKIKFNVNVSLSAKHLYNGIEKKKSSDAVKNFEEMEKFLKTNGIVQEKDCECEKRTDKKDPCNKKIEEKTVNVLKIDQLVSIKNVNEEELIQLVKLCPVMVSLDATEELKAHLGDGIFFGAKKGRKAKGNHVVLVTGYGTTVDGQHYWIIQNSWGLAWGDRGFGKIARKISRGKNEHSLFAEIVYPVISALDGFP